MASLGHPQATPHLDTLPLGGSRASAARLLSGSAYPEVRAYRPAALILLERPKDLAEHVTRACRPQASSPGIQGGKVARPQGPSPRSGPWVPRPESKAGHQSSEQLRHMIGIIPTVYGGKT